MELIFRNNLCAEDFSSIRIRFPTIWVNTSKDKYIQNFSVRNEGRMNRMTCRQSLLFYTQYRRDKIVIKSHFCLKKLCLIHFYNRTRSDNILFDPSLISLADRFGVDQICSVSYSARFIDRFNLIRTSFSFLFSHSSLFWNPNEYNLHLCPLKSDIVLIPSFRCRWW